MFLRSCSVLLVVAISSAAGAGDWPQWRGPDRDNVSRETGLLKEWPADGPPLLWRAEGVGAGVPSVAVAGGKVFVLGYRGEQEWLSAVREEDGTSAWSVPIGPAVKELSVMRWLSQRTPTVDGDRVYAFTARGELVCLATADGREQWRKDYTKDFQGKPGPWGYCDFPLVDRDRLICTPGGTEATLVALHKKTGAVVWKCAGPEKSCGTYGGVVASEGGGIRQYVHQLENGVVGVAASDGKLLWHYAGLKDSRGNVHTALIQGDEVFASCGWGQGAALLKLSAEGGAVKMAPLFENAKIPFDSWLGSSVRLGQRVYAANGFSAEWKTGAQVVRSGPGSGRITMTCADGRLYYRNADNVVTLVEVNDKGEYVQRGELKVPHPPNEPAWSTPVVANGRLYLRDQDVLLCYDLVDKQEKPAEELDAIFVPSPQDVVDQMLALAAVNVLDFVADLGCGDGRIVISAARDYGCRAIGYDLDPECVRLSRAAVREAGLEKQVRIQQQNIFQADLEDISVVTLFLGPEVNARLAPQLAEMKSGSRIVSHAFDLPGFLPDKVVSYESNEDGVTRSLYLWTTPLKAAPR